MAKLGKGVAAIKARGENKGGTGRKAGAFTPLWTGLKNSGDEVFMQFQTDLEDVEELALHTFVRVPSRREDREFDFEVFASRTRNERFGDDFSLLEEEMNHWPDIKFAGIAVLLEPVYDDTGKKRIGNIERFDVVGRSAKREDGSDIFYPAWQLVYMSSGSFWSNLISIHNNYGITEHPVFVQRHGEKTDTKYNFLPITGLPPIDFSEYDGMIPTLDEEIDRLGSTERYDEYFGPGKRRLKQVQQYPPATKPKETPKTEVVEEEAVPAKKGSTRAPRSRVNFDELDKLTGDDDDQETIPY